MGSNHLVAPINMDTIVPLPGRVPLSFDSCRNRHKGPVFIVASGQSAKNFPLSEFSTVPMITMNGAISLFSAARVNPFFYICTDPSFPEQQPRLFETGLKCSKNIALRQNLMSDMSCYNASGHLYLLKKAISPNWFTSLFRKKRDLIHTFSPISKRKSSIGFSKDMNTGFYDARTVAYAALQLAYHLGFDTVFLIGVDLTQSTGRFYETRQSKISPCGLDTYFDTRILPAFKLMSKKIVSDKFRVFNLSASSRIPESIIPKIDLDDARRMIVNHRETF